MAQSEAHITDVIQIHDETLFGNSKNNKVGFVEQVQNFNQQITILQKLPELYDKEQLDALLLLIADKTEIIDAYSKTEDDVLLLLKTNVADIVESYSKIKDDALLLLKAIVAINVESYSRTEDDALLLQKADKTELIDIYSKTQTDTLLDAKTDKTDLASYVDLTSAQIISGGGNILVSSPVIQSQLKEVSNIATGKSKAYVLSTQEELNDWMAIQDNVAKLVIGDNLYIVDKEVTDYWWDGTDIKILETELSDMSNVITTFGTATGGGKATTDLSIDVNILTPAKNKNFVDTDYDQSISGQKTFNTTIHSVGIMVQTYDKTFAVCAGRGVRSIADIQNASYSKSEDDALLLLKADKTQLIDSYSKSETYARDDVYTKSEDDALLLLKADKTQLIDSNTKDETNNLLNSKTDNGVTYSKSETNDRDEIDTSNVDLRSYYSKTKTDEFLDEKANTTDLSNYMNLCTAQKINANKTFNNACRFVSSIDGMSTVTESSFVKSDADDTVVLLGAGGTKPISDGTYDETQDPVENTYLTQSQVDTFNANVNATGFVKAVKDDTQVLLAGSGDRLLSSFGEIEELLSSAFSGMNSAVVQSKLIRIGSLYIFSLLAYGGNYNMGTFNPDYLVTDDTAVATYIPFPNRTIDKRGYVMITRSIGLITLKSYTNSYIQCASATWVK
ncbi:MAG: hypothetical protein EZS28_007903 [Streblomastix strix]|uniref:Uncharacterized protein n=1 Tax=Streblomastix strix TaxID=222440 RepID=A0A5J4WNP2_9EUKA|nr:MAG: hypothetical protein EZS28_007903 [Streblomastix strix]